MGWRLGMEATKDREEEVEVGLVDPLDLSEGMAIRTMGHQDLPLDGMGMALQGELDMEAIQAM